MRLLPAPSASTEVLTWAQAASYRSPRQGAVVIPAANRHLPRRPPWGATSCPGIRFTPSPSGKCETNLLWWPSFKPSAPSQLLWVSSSPKFLIKRNNANIFPITDNQPFHIPPQQNIIHPFEMMMLLPFLTKEKRKKIHLDDYLESADCNTLIWQCFLNNCSCIFLRH